jgi:hypothetical protein
MSEPVRAQAMRLSAAATRKPLSESSLLALAKNGSTAAPALPLRAAIGSHYVCATSPANGHWCCKPWEDLARISKAARAIFSCDEP